MAMAQVLVLRKEPLIAPAEVAVRVDRYLAGFRAQRKWLIRAALIGLAYWPLATLRPPFHMMSVDLRERWIRRRFVDDVADRVIPGWLRTARQTTILAAQQFSYMGYYADEAAAEKAGYVPFSRRPGYAEAMKQVDPERPGVRCMAPGDIPGEELTADVVIVGTGAAGATLAHELAHRGREVLMLERGSHVPPSDFTENEAEQLSKLYANGALNFSTDFHFRVVQGMCVGGSTVVNNAVCFDLPPHVLERWNDPDGLNAGLDAARLWSAFAPRAQAHAGCDRRPSRGAQPGRVPDHRRAQAHRALAVRAGRVQHRRLPRLRLLQHRLCVREEAVGARLDAAAGPARVPRCGARPPRLPCREGARARQARLRGARPPRGRPATHRPCQHDRAQRGHDRLQPDPPAQRPRRRARRPRPVVQHGLAGDVRVRRGPALRARHADLALHAPHGRQRRRPRLRDVVQPDRRAVALHARLVRGALGQHAPLRPHDVASARWSGRRATAASRPTGCSAA